MSPCRCLPLLTCLLVSAVGSHTASAFGLTDLREMLGGGGETEGLSQDQAAAGLREALRQGAEVAVARLGTAGGFVDNPEVRIPPPGPLASMESGLRGIGLGSVADDFSLAMNRAAEQAVAVALPVLGEAVENMTLSDAVQIARGSEHAATDYLRATSAAQIQSRMLPLVSEATARTGVTGHYKKLTDRAGPLLSAQVPDLDRYVTEQAVGGLFHVIAQEEQRIRQNPAARTTELLRRVFSR
ncbi:MAG: DUF4197 domain-containing protein [Pseudomonadota bacterium]|nr:DUF4197 domain-containing protein [Pseudomonadota bacterium]